LTLLGMGKIGKEGLVEVFVSTTVVMLLGMGIGGVQLGEGIGCEDLVELVPSAFLLLGMW